jgi:hypothetical protein
MHEYAHLSVTLYNFTLSFIFAFMLKNLINGEPVRHLYVIGNGFDRYHGAKSSYWDFRGYLIRHDDFALKMFELFFGPRAMMNNFQSIRDYLLCLQYGRTLPVPRNTWACKCLWSDFERYLGELNRERVFDFVDEDLSESEKEEGGSCANFYAIIERVSDIVKACSVEMQYHFHRWINTVHYEKGFRKKMLQLDGNAAFLNFNYTLFLETEYDIPREQIVYIHGDRRQRFGKLVLGHRVEDDEEAFDEWIHKNRNRRRYRPNLKGKNGRYFANDKLVYLAFFSENEAKGNWRLPIRYYAVDLIEERLEGYYKENVKRCGEIIDRNLGFFKSLRELREITVLGHSLSDVDLPYFKAILENVVDPEYLKWQFSYHNDADICRIKRFCRQLKIPEGKNVQLFRMSDLKR